MDIVQQSCAFLNTIKPTIQSKVRPLLQFGFQALSLQRINSLNSNARITVQNTKTAESKIYRLTKNQRLLKLLPQLVNQLNLVQPNDLINVDFSDFNGRQVLMFAKQTREGRAIPLYFEYIEYPVKTGSQNIFIMRAIGNFLNLMGTTKVKLVFDRGFAAPDLVRYLLYLKVIFYVRIKQDKTVQIKNKAKKARLVHHKSQTVAAYKRHNLRLIRSDKPSGESEPWYIITNDKRSGRERIIDIYYHRFEIEELFRDGKRVFGLEYIKVKKDSTFRILLWFVMLGMWFLWWLKGLDWYPESRVRRKFKSGYQLSLITYWLEWLQYEIRAQIIQNIVFNTS